MQKTNTAEAQAALDAQEEIRKRAARQAAKRELAQVVHDTVECVVLPMGHGKISMGEHIAGLGTAHFEEGEKFPAELPTAVALYDRGFVNFEGARQASADAKAKRAHDEAAEAAADAVLKKQLEAAGF